MVATNIAEVKGAAMVTGVENKTLSEDTGYTIDRIRSKLSSLESNSE